MTTDWMDWALAAAVVLTVWGVMWAWARGLRARPDYTEDLLQNRRRRALGIARQEPKDHWKVGGQGGRPEGTVAGRTTGRTTGETIQRWAERVGGAESEMERDRRG